MKRTYFRRHTPPHSQNHPKITAFLTALFLLAFANLFAFSLAEEFPGDPGDPDNAAGVSQGETDETGNGDGTSDPNEPNAPGNEGDLNETGGENTGDPNETGETENENDSNEPNENEDGEDALAPPRPALFDTQDATVSLTAGNEQAIRDAVAESGRNATPCIVTIDTTVTLTGALTVPEDADVTLTGGGILAQDGYLITVEDRAKLTLAGDLTIRCTDASSGARRGGVLNQGFFRMTGGTITGGKGVKMSPNFLPGNALYAGGGVYNEAEMIMDGGIIKSCAAADLAEGGGVFNDKDGTFTMNKGSIRENTASLGGGIFNNAELPDPMFGGGGPAVLGRLILNGGSICKNIAQAANGGAGGGVYNTGDLKIYSCSIEQNKALTAGSAGGGGVYNNGIALMSGGHIFLNQAYRGGGVSNAPDSPFTLNGGGSIFGNVATKEGGGFYNAGGEFIMATGSIFGNIAGENGGNVYNTGGFSVSVNFTLSDGTIIYGQAKQGSGVYNAADATFDLSGGTISDDFYLSTDTPDGPGDGSGVYNAGTLRMTGGRISSASGIVGVRNVEGGVFTMNGDGARVSNGDRRGVSNAGTFIMTRGAITENKGYGLDNYATAILDGGEISHNITGVFNTGSLTLAGSGLIATNSAALAGGLYNSFGGTFTMAGGAISHNTANSGGGLINVGEAILTGGDITGNTAKYGGGIVNLNEVDTKLCMAGTAVRGNTADEGGGLYIYDSDKIRFGVDSAGGPLGSSPTVIEKNRATTGGGLYMSYTGSFDVGDNIPVLIQYNTAQVGGGICGDGNAVRLGSGVRVEANHAVSADGQPGLGGGIYKAGSGALNLAGAVVSDNDASDGGGVYVTEDTPSFEMAGGAIRGNTADYLGGGLYCAGSAATFSSGATVTGNTAKFGGGLYLKEYAVLSLSGAGALKFSGNRATAGTFRPADGDALLTNPAYANGAFASYSRPALGTAFTNDDINYIRDVTVTYKDSTGKAQAGALPRVESLTAAYAADFSGDTLIHRIASAPVAAGNDVFKGWKLVGNVLAFLGDRDTPDPLNGEDTDITFVLSDLGKIFRPLADVILEAVWGNGDNGNNGGGGGGNGGGGGGGNEGGGNEGGGGDNNGGDNGGGGTGGGGNGGGTGGGGTVTPAARPARPAAPTPAPAATVAQVTEAPALPAPSDAPVSDTAPAPVPTRETPTPAPANAFENFLAMTGISPLGIPLAAPGGEAWAILNLVFAALTLVVAAFAALRRRLDPARRSRAEGAESGVESTARERGPGFAYTVLAAVGGFVSLVTFVLTENVTLTPAWLDRFSPFMFVLFVLVCVFAALGARARGRAAGSDAEEARAV